MARKNPVLSRLHRVTDLFKTGEALVLNDDPDDPVVVWVQKLNNFQRQDALRDAEYGRSKRMAALTEESQEVVEQRAAIAYLDDDKLISNILDPRGNELWGLAREDVMASEEWQDKVRALRDAGAARAEGSYIPEEEEERIAGVSREFLEAIQKRADQRTRDAVRDLKAKTRTELEQEYIDEWRKLRSLDAWQDEYNRTEIWYALRDCVPGDLPPTEYHRHAHPQLLESRRDIYELPDELIEKVTATVRALTVPVSEAGNSAAPRSSSASSEQPGTAEDSTASTPTQTSSEPDTTSSTPSPVP